MARRARACRPSRATAATATGASRRIIDRLKFAGQGIAGGKPGAIGEYVLDTGEHLPAKMLVPLAPRRITSTSVSPAAAATASRSARPAEEVLRDVVHGYVTIEAAEREYGVVIRYAGDPDRLVRLPEHYEIDAERDRPAARGRHSSRLSANATPLTSSPAISGTAYCCRTRGSASSRPRALLAATRSVIRSST